MIGNLGQRRCFVLYSKSGFTRLNFSRLSLLSDVQIIDSFTGEVGILLFDLYLFLYGFVERLIRLFHLRVRFRNQRFRLLDLEVGGFILTLVFF